MKFTLSNAEFLALATTSLVLTQLVVGNKTLVPTQIFAKVKDTATPFTYGANTRIVFSSGDVAMGAQHSNQQLTPGLVAPMIALEMQDVVGQVFEPAQYTSLQVRLTGDAPIVAGGGPQATVDVTVYFVEF